MARTPPPRRHTTTWIIVTILLAASLVGTLWVPFYSRTTPALGGFPFFYWYQLIWVPIVAILSWAAYLLSKTVQRGGARHGSGTSSGTSSGTAPGAGAPRNGEVR